MASAPARACLPPAPRFESRSAPDLLGRVDRRLGAPDRREDPHRAASRARRSPRLRERCRDLASASGSAWACARSTALCPAGAGSGLGIFAGSGVGKSSLLGMIARSTSAQVNVIALVGERGREVREFIERDLGERFERSVVVVATSDQPALVRIKAAFTATAIAEHFRDEGHDVLLMMDSVTRFAMAQREVGLAIGEPPATRGYTPERVRAACRACSSAPAPAQAGSITAPLHGPGRRRRHERADRRRGPLDPRRARGAHALAGARRSLSGDRRPAERLALGRRDRAARGLEPPASACARRWPCCARRKTSWRSAPIKPARDPALDTALAHRDPIERFLRQAVDEPSTPAEADSNLLALAASLTGEQEQNEPEILDAEAVSHSDATVVDTPIAGQNNAVPSVALGDEPAIPALGLSI